MKMYNKDRIYHISNQNVSDVRQSIHEQINCSDSKVPEIAQIISYSKTASKFQGVLSKDVKASNDVIGGNQYRKSFQRIDDKTKTMNQIKQESYKAKSKPGSTFLGDQIYHVIKERYFQVNRITTQSPEVLYDFYILQGKTSKASKSKPETQTAIQSLLPSLQRKVLMRQHFERILKFNSQDVYYSLHCTTQTKKKQEQQEKKKKILQNQMKQQNKVKKIKPNINTIVEHLYGKTEAHTHKQVNPKDKRRMFGCKLSEQYQNTYRNSDNIETSQKLYTYWQEMYDRDEYGLEWDEKNAQSDIRLYMKEQIEDMIILKKGKIGFKCTKSSTLAIFYKNYHYKLHGIHIPPNSLEQYIKVYNEVQAEEQNKEKESKKELQKYKSLRRSPIKKQIPATPFAILQKPRKYEKRCRRKKFSKSQTWLPLGTVGYNSFNLFPKNYPKHKEDLFDVGQISATPLETLKLPKGQLSMQRYKFSTWIPAGRSSEDTKNQFGKSYSKDKSKSRVLIRYQSEEDRELSVTQFKGLQKIKQIKKVIQQNTDKP